MSNYSLKTMDGMVLEDDVHDWLAREMKEEALAYQRVSEMFQMKLSHMADCQAKRLKEEHEKACAADLLRKETAKNTVNFTKIE